MLITSFLLVSLILLALIALTFIITRSAIVEQKEQSLQEYMVSIAQGMNQWLEGYCERMRPCICNSHFHQFRSTSK